MRTSVKQKRLSSLCILLSCVGAMIFLSGCKSSHKNQQAKSNLEALKDQKLVLRAKKVSDGKITFETCSIRGGTVISSSCVDSFIQKSGQVPQYFPEQLKNLLKVDKKALKKAMLEEKPFNADHFGEMLVSTDPQDSMDVTSVLAMQSILVIFLNKLSLTDEGRIVQSCYPLFVRGRQVTEKQCDTHQFSMASLSNPDPKKMYILGHLPSEIQEQVYEHYDQTYRNQGSEVGELSEDALVRYNPETKQWTLVEIKQAGAGVGVGVLAGTLGFLLMALPDFDISSEFSMVLRSK